MVINTNLLIIQSFKVDLSKQQAGFKIILNVTAADGGDLLLTGSTVVDITILSKTASNATDMIMYTTVHTSTTSTAKTSTSLSTTTSAVTTSSEETTKLQMSHTYQSSGEINVYVIVGSVLLSLAIIMICASIIIWRCVERKPVINGKHCFPFSELMG